MGKTTIASLSKAIQTESQAYAYLESLRWGDMPTCGHCTSLNVYLINCSNGVSRRTRTGSESQRRVWKCRGCKRQFSVLTGTIMHGTKVSVRVWVLVIFEMCSSRNGTSAREVERRYGVTPRTAWHMLHRIRKAMSNDGLDLAPMKGTIVADETWIGGEPKNWHANDPRNLPQAIIPWQRSSVRTDKTPVFTMIDNDTRETRSVVLTRITGDTLGKALHNNVAIYGSRLWTDTAALYRKVGHQFEQHETVNHHAGQFTSKTGATSNRAEGYFSQLKRSLNGTHHHVTAGHLHRYVAEFDFRYTTCKMGDFERMVTLMGRCERRLPYKALTLPR